MLLRLVGGGKHEESVYHKSKKARLDDQDGVQYIGDGKLDQGKDQDVDQEEKGGLLWEEVLPWISHGGREAIAEHGGLHCSIDEESGIANVGLSNIGRRRY